MNNKCRINEHKHSCVSLTDLPDDILKLILNYYNNYYIGKLACINKKFYTLINNIRITYCVSKPEYGDIKLTKTMMPNCKDVIINNWDCDEHFMYHLRKFLIEKCHPEVFLELFSSKGISFDNYFVRTVRPSFISRISICYRRTLEHNIFNCLKPLIIKIHQLSELGNFYQLFKDRQSIQIIVLSGTDGTSGTINYDMSNNRIQLVNISKSKFKANGWFPHIAVSYL
jgi:hypothetical protein